MNTHTLTADEAGFRQSLSTQSGIQTASTSNKKLWAGRILSALPALFLLSSGVNMSMKASFVMEGTTHLGYPESVVLGIGIVEFVCALLYIIPRTSILGAILLTGYLGGATASHVRVGDPLFGPILAGVLVWAGLFLRDDRLRALIPLRSQPTQ
jgi:hypothetical protein